MLTNLRNKIRDFWENTRVRNWLLFRMTALYWRLEDYKETTPSIKTGTRSFIFFEPISMSAIITSLVISAASFAASYALNTLLAPSV